MLMDLVSIYKTSSNGEKSDNDEDTKVFIV